MWTPNTALHTCTSESSPPVPLLLLCMYVHTYVVDCGELEFPSTGTINMSDTTVGGVATFQCEEGLMLTGSNTSTCTDTGNDTLPGKWIPNPALTSCRNLCMCNNIYVLAGPVENPQLVAFGVSPSLLPS